MDSLWNNMYKTVHELLILSLMVSHILCFPSWLYSIYNVKWTYDKVSKPPTQISMNISLSVYTQKKI